MKTGKYLITLVIIYPLINPKKVPVQLLSELDS